MTNTPAGWYPDPEFDGQQRYWDGSSWTVNRAPRHDTTATTVASGDGRSTGRTGDSTLAVLALVLAILGFVLGVLPFAAWFAWLPFVPALILAIRVLMARRPGRGQATWAIVIVGVGWLLSLFMGVVSIGVLAGGSDSQTGAAAVPSASSSVAPPTSAPPATPTAPPTTAPPAAAAGVGQPVTSRAGVAFSVSGMQCGLGAQEDVFGEVAPKGQFCKVDFVVANGSAQPQDVSASDIFGYIENARYKPDNTLGRFGDDSFLTTVNPGLTVNCTVYFDVPPGASLDRVKLITSWWGGDGATVTLR
ncbi:DUF4352 domain-containing protein [Leifsonia sp. NPDC058292]|uniref:DUF4352 domain-containing protein n=1 Tax=Leifsonia sp. NPDC058292 TaxID=3346428 RepID=UPI0036DEDA6E